MTQEPLTIARHPYFASRTISLQTHENFYENAQKKGMDYEAVMRAIGYAASWAALHPRDEDKKDTLELHLQYDGEISALYRDSEGRTFYMCGIPRQQDSSYSFHS